MNRSSADIILRNGRFTTLDRSNPRPDAVAIREGRFVQVGDEHQVMRLKRAGTRVVDCGQRRVIPAFRTTTSM